MLGLTDRSLITLITAGLAPNAPVTESPIYLYQIALIIPDLLSIKVWVSRKWKKSTKKELKKNTILKKVLKKGDAPFKVLKKVFYIFFVMLKKK